MNLVQSYMTNNPRYKQKKTFTPKGLMLHSVGVNQPKASVFISQWNKSTFKTSCVHGVIDANDGTAYQLLPWNYMGWHAGETANSTHIGVEMCEPAEIKYISGATFSCSNATAAKAAATRTYNTAVELFAFLCKQYNLDPLTQICSHSEGYKKGIATNHADPEHLWKGLGLSYTMDGFRKDVKAAMGGQLQNGSQTATSSSGVPYIVRVTVTNLNIRKGPGTSYASRGHIEPGAYTIVEETSDGWGLLKSYQSSRDGWIFLQYANRI